MAKEMMSGFFLYHCTKEKGLGYDEFLSSSCRYTARRAGGGLPPTIRSTFVVGCFCLLVVFVFVSSQARSDISR